MLAAAIKEYLGGGVIGATDAYEASLRVGEPADLVSRMLGIREATVLVVFYTDEIAFREIAGLIRQAVSARYAEKKIRMRCTWLVCSASGGIYLYEALAANAKESGRHMKNRFVVFNSENGTVSLGPGNAHNRAISERMRNLFGQSRFMTQAVWRREIAAVVDVCLAAIGGK